MSTKWEVKEDKDGIRIRGSVDILVDPKRVPEDAYDLDFVVLTSRSDEKVLEKVLEASEATLITPSAVKRTIRKRYIVDTVEGIKGLSDDVWVIAKDGKLAIFLYTEEGPVAIADDFPEEMLEKASDYVYGEKLREVLKKGNIGGRVF
ncbi:hypothetical protein IPA_08040 [Ignicoccus pacificus DSM 13166]|uniref:Uncharacterized protein n=1 Tax=Ignicoccus pacificus DSM 13166 TaxID=940294 RepID=A0A977KBR1_9CREN|nr:hypothetical protein IPA_08040 [Ignicoccus pacificus DSM 13166]